MVLFVTCQFRWIEGWLMQSKLREVNQFHLNRNWTLFSGSTQGTWHGNEAVTKLHSPPYFYYFFLAICIVMSAQRQVTMPMTTNWWYSYSVYLSVLFGTKVYGDNGFVIQTSMHMDVCSVCMGSYNTWYMDFHLTWSIDIWVLVVQKDFFFLNQLHHCWIFFTSTACTCKASPLIDSIHVR